MRSRGRGRRRKASLPTCRMAAPLDFIKTLTIFVQCISFCDGGVDSAVLASSSEGAGPASAFGAQLRGARGQAAQGAEQPITELPYWSMMPMPRGSKAQRTQYLHQYEELMMHVRISPISAE